MHVTAFFSPRGVTLSEAAQIMAIISFVLIAMMGIFARLLWTGFQQTIVKTVIESAMKQVFEGYRKDIELTRTEVRAVSSDISHIRSASTDVLARLTQNTVDISNLRDRMDQTLADRAAQAEEYANFKTMVGEFIYTVRLFMQQVNNYMDAHDGKSPSV